MDFLQEILLLKRARVAEAKAIIGMDKLRHAAAVRTGVGAHRLHSALARDAVNIIAEIKRASPSKGVIRAELNPEQTALAYASGGAVAISILTEEDRFKGSLQDLEAVRGATGLPLLRKDFIFDEYQIYEAAAAGADAILLIVAALENEDLVRLRKLAEGELGLDALVEVHTEAELDRALAGGARLIGVNNRNLRTFEVSLDVSRALARGVDADVTLVAESGISTSDHISELRALGYKGFLVGESLMRADDPAAALRALTE